MAHDARRDAQLLAHKHRVDAERRKAAIAKREANNVTAMHKVAASK